MVYLILVEEQPILILVSLDGQMKIKKMREDYSYIIENFGAWWR